MLSENEKYMQASQEISAKELAAITPEKDF